MLYTGPYCLLNRIAWSIFPQVCSEHYCRGRADWFTVGMSATVVQKLCHIGEGFGTERAPVERLRCMGLPRNESKRSIWHKALVAHFSQWEPISMWLQALLVYLPVYDEGHFRSEAVPTVHTQKAGLPGVCAHVCMQ